MPFNRRSTLCALAALTATCALPVRAQQAWPSRPVSVIVPFPAGGPTDLAARLVSLRLGERLGQPFVVENRPGALAMLGTDRVAKSAPDGHTLLLTPQSPITIAEHFEPRPPYQAARDLVPVAAVVTSPVVILGNADGPADLRALVAQARANPGKVFYGAPGLGNEMHLTWELIRSALKLDVTAVPYQGTNPAVMDLMAGRVQVVVTSPSSVKGHLSERKLRGLATLTPRRLPEFPDIPTLAESGFGDIAMPVAWLGMLAPSKIPSETLARLRREIVLISAEPAYRQRMTELGFDIPAQSPDEFPAMVAAQRVQWGELIRTQNIQINAAK
jgi:tripartite-type tricarboxylate transporter receptor subunit TctC